MNGSTLAEVIATGRGTERPFRCHMHDDSNASASVNVVKGVWLCYACGARGTVEGIDLVPEAEEILRILSGQAEQRSYAESWLDVFDAYSPSPYWAKRFGVEVADRHRTGTHPLTGAPTYPIRDVGGRPIGVVQRGEADPKYLYPCGVSTSRTLYGLIAPKPVVVLVEGAADVMAIDASGIPDNWTVLGTYGAGIHLPQVQVIRELAPYVIVLAFDNDAAGHLAMIRSELSLSDVAPTVSFNWGDMGGNDPGDVAVELRVAGLKEALTTTPYRLLA